MSDPGKSIAARKLGKPPARRFPDNSFFSLAGDAAMARMGTEKSLPVPMRLWAICVSRANVWGHAHFRPKELSETLGRVNEDTRLKAIKTLKSARLIAPASDSLCIVLDAGTIRRGDRSTIACSRHPGLERRMWVAQMDPMWEPYDGAWQGMLDRGAEGQAMITAGQWEEYEVVTKTKTITTTTVETVETRRGGSGSAVVIPLPVQAARECFHPGCSDTATVGWFCAEHRGQIAGPPPGYYPQASGG